MTREMTRCYAAGNDSICSICCLIFFWGPRFFGAAVVGAVSWATSASSVVCSVVAITGSKNRGQSRLS